MAVAGVEALAIGIFQGLGIFGDRDFGTIKAIEAVEAVEVTKERYWKILENDVIHKHRPQFLPNTVSGLRADKRELGAGLVCPCTCACGPHSSFWCWNGVFGLSKNRPNRKGFQGFGANAPAEPLARVD